MLEFYFWKCQCFFSSLWCYLDATEFQKLNYFWNYPRIDYNHKKWVLHCL
jgi:hypothetical protein